MLFQQFQPIWFLTVTNNQWYKLLELDEYKLIIESSLNYLVLKKRCSIYGFVFMPNHIHLLLDIHEHNKNIFQRDFLKYTAQKCILKMIDNKSVLLPLIKSTQSDRKFQFWERRPMWVEVRSVFKWHEKLSYIHLNPVDSSKVDCESMFDYKWSSASLYRDGRSYFDFLSLLEVEDE